MHLVNRKGYWSLETSIREGKKVRKRQLAYYGRRGPPTEMKQMFDGTDYGLDWHYFKDRPLRSEVEDRAQREALARLPAGLHVGSTDPSPVDTSPAVEPSTGPSEQSGAPSSEATASTPSDGS